MLVKELKALARDRMTFGMVVMIPLVQLLLFGYAINTDVRHIPAGLVDFSGSVYGRNLGDERYARVVLIPPVSNFGQYNEPRNYGVELSLTF